MMRNKHLFKSLMAVTIILLLNCCNLPSQSQINITIESHEDGQTVELNEEIHIISYANAYKGIKSIELYANDTLIGTSTPPIVSPNEFTADLP